jgi:hypothetical protein
LTIELFDYFVEELQHDNIGPPVLSLGVLAGDLRFPSSDDLRRRSLPRPSRTIVTPQFGALDKQNRRKPLAEFPFRFEAAFVVHPAIVSGKSSTLRVGY